MLTRAEVALRCPDSFRAGRKWNKAIAERLLLDVKEIFDANNIKFWLVFGTLWGAYHYGGLLPWDEDVDIAVYHEDNDRISACQGLFTEKGILYAPEPDGVLVRDNEHIDLCSFELVGEKRSSFPSSPNIPYEIDASAFETPNWVEFLGQCWRILNETEKWLYYFYGPNQGFEGDLALPQHHHADAKQRYSVDGW